MRPLIWAAVIILQGGSLAVSVHEHHKAKELAERTIAYVEVSKFIGCEARKSRALLNQEVYVAFLKQEIETWGGGKCN